jgi:protein involved in polysaccharide export with SLBB domain
LPGCWFHREHVRQALRDKANPSPPAATAAQPYRIGCPDLLEVAVEGRPECSGVVEVQANGCVDLGRLGGVRLENLTPAEAEGRIAQIARVSPLAVRVQVREHRSQHVYLFGEVTGLQRAVAYTGPETVVELLRRTGGITADGAPAGVRIVRNPRLEQPEPQVIQVDLEAILMKNDSRTNVTVQPFDQIYVPETRQAKVGKCLPPWLRPLGRLFCPEG